MANITINNTDKAGYIRLELNDYFNGVNGDWEHYIPISGGITRVCSGMADGNSYVELHVNGKPHAFFLTDSGVYDNIKIVDSVNGVAPTSLDDLKDKILALI